MHSYFLTTPRIGFSTWQPEDLPLAELLWGNPDVTRYICANGSFTKQQIQTRLQQEITQQHQHGVQYWPIFALEGNCFMGCCGLRPYKDETSVYEIGFHLLPAFWGKGTGTEAAKAVMQYAFATLGATSLFAGHNPNNTGSRKVLERLGFQYTGDEYYEPTGLHHPSYRYTPSRIL